MLLGYLRPKWRKKLALHFEEGSDPETFIEQALSQLPDRVMGLGTTTGFVVNYTPGHPVRQARTPDRKVGRGRASSIGRNHHRRQASQQPIMSCLTGSDSDNGY